nr:helix-turn-helix domain-containing protein [Candidatus Vondammii sp. HM_W22]
MERRTIPDFRLVESRRNQTDVAVILGRHKSTISREIRRNRSP